MKVYMGTAENIETRILGLVTRNPLSLSRRKSILVAEETPLMSRGFAGFITNDSGKKKKLLPQVSVSGDILDKLEEGDCVVISPDGSIRVLWEKKARENSLLLTEMCNCRCLMCPQPPKEHDRTLTETSMQILNLVKIESDQMVCLTGGESTLLKEDFFKVLEVMKRKHPKAAVMLLTNGKSFGNFEFTKRFVSSRPSEFLTCVSLHSDVDDVHDRIAGIQGSFYKTVMGLHNLARFREMVEIRVVVSRMNAHRLESIATFIQRNFPFIIHCAFMGMEITGFARDNYDTVWIDPYEYRNELAKAVKVLHRADIDVSIYNIPLCLVESGSWRFARQSISEWKNDYLPICENCSVKPECCGIFTSSGCYQSPSICPI